MQYKSPIHILSSFIKKTENIKELNINVLKKRILAEFELKGKSTIKIKEAEYSKNDILTTIENLNLQSDFEHHYTISRFQELLSLLEKNEPSGQLSFSDPSFQDKDFIHFLSPYLAYSLGHFFASCIRNPKRPIQFAAHVTFPVLGEHQYLLTQPVNDAIEKIIAEVDSLQSLFNISESFPDSSIYFKSDLIRVFNLLPRFYFSEMVNLYAQCGINHIQAFLNYENANSPYYSRIHFIFGQLQNLLVSKEIKDNLNLFKNYFVSSESEIDDNAPNYLSEGVIGVLLYLLLMVIVFFVYFSISKKKDSYRPNNTIDYSVIKKLIEDQQKEQDSILKSIEDKKLEIKTQYDSLSFFLILQNSIGVNDTNYRKHSNMGDSVYLKQ